MGTCIGGEKEDQSWLPKDLGMGFRKIQIEALKILGNRFLLNLVLLSYEAISGKENVLQNRSTFGGSRFGVLAGMDENPPTEDSVEVIRG